MPLGNYEVHQILGDRSVVYGHFDTPEEAAQFANDMNTEMKSLNQQYRYRVSPRISDEMKQMWRWREKGRFLAGTYTPVLWANEPWAAYPDHFPHLSPKGDGLIAYTPDDKHGIDDRQVPIKVGRYLNKFYGDCCLLTPDAIAEWCARCGAEQEDNIIRFAEAADEIQRVYQTGPQSCMSHPTEFYKLPFHPVRVYAGSDLCIAYLQRAVEDARGKVETRITARAVCFRAQKVYGRVYGDGYRFQALMGRLGFSYTDKPYGARIPIVPHPRNKGHIIVPYIDYVEAAKFVPGDEKHPKGYIELAPKGPLRGLNHQMSVVPVPCCPCGEVVTRDGAEGFADSSGYLACEKHSTEEFRCARCRHLYWHKHYHRRSIDGAVMYCAGCTSRLPACKHCGNPVFNHEKTEAPEVCRNCFPNMVRTPGCGNWIHKMAPACQCALCHPPSQETAAGKDKAWIMPTTYEYYTAATTTTIPALRLTDWRMRPRR